MRVLRSSRASPSRLLFGERVAALPGTHCPRGAAIIVAGLESGNTRHKTLGSSRPFFLSFSQYSQDGRRRCARAGLLLRSDDAVTAQRGHHCCRSEQCKQACNT